MQQPTFSPRFTLAAILACGGMPACTERTDQDSVAEVIVNGAQVSRDECFGLLQQAREHSETQKDQTAQCIYDNLLIEARSTKAYDADIRSNIFLDAAQHALKIGHVHEAIALFEENIKVLHAALGSKHSSRAGRGSTVDDETALREGLVDTYLGLYTANLEYRYTAAIAHVAMRLCDDSFLQESQRHLARYQKEIATFFFNAHKLNVIEQKSLVCTRLFEAVWPAHGEVLRANNPQHAKQLLEAQGLHYLTLRDGLAAAECFREALTLHELLGPGVDHQKRSEVILNLGRSYVCEGMSQLGLREIEKSIAEVSRIYGRDSRLCLPYKTAHPILLVEMGEYSKATAKWRTLLKDVRRCEGGESFQEASVAAQAARSFHEAGHLSLAASYRVTLEKLILSLNALLASERDPVRYAQSRQALDKLILCGFEGVEAPETIKQIYSLK